MDAETDADADADAAALDETAAELYALTPAEFTAARNARAAASAPSLARAIKALRKPSAAAFAVDLLAQSRADELREALELSSALHDAQDDLDGAELARLGRQRRALVAALARTAAGLAVARGVAVSAAARTEVEETIDAAVRDASAAAAVLTGRLIRTLRADGVDPVDLEGAVGGSVPGVASAPAPDSAPRRDDLAARRLRRAAERALRDAERVASEADRARARADAVATKAQERADHLDERVGDLRAELERLERDAATAADAAAAAAEDRDAAAAAAARAADAVADAGQALAGIE